MMITIERKKEQLPWSTLSWIWSGIRRFTFSEMVKDPVFLTGEIIQIGAIKLNQTLEVVDSFNERIAPQYYTELHPKVAEITKLSNRDLQKGKGFHWNLEKLRDFLHVLRRVKVLSIFFIMNISTSVYTGVVSYVSLPQAFLVSKPAELVRCFSDFGEVRELQIELFCILKLVRQYHRKLKNL